MKRYIVNVHFDAITSVRVFANTEKEALEKAKAIAYYRPQQDFDFEYSDACTTDTEDVEDTPSDNINVLAFPLVEYDREDLYAMTKSELREVAEQDENVFRYDSFQHYMEELARNPELLKNYVFMNV